MDFKTLRNDVVRPKGNYLKKLIISAAVIIVFSVLAVVTHRLVDKYVYKGNSVTHLNNEWKQYNYQNVYDISTEILKEKPFNNAALTFKGYSAFFLALSENDTSRALSLLDESIISIRIALQDAKSKTVPQLEYMLGKAYFYKNSISTYYYYADLAVLYLNRAEKDGYKAQDIPEYLGLSYAALDMTMESIAAFTKALLSRESDLLLLSIAEQYFKAGQSRASEQYLYRISQECKEEKIINKSHLLLGQIYLEQKKFNDAEKEFLLILENNENSADAFYGLGVIYENQGDLIKARSFWRKALRIQSNHAGALKKIAEYK